MSTPYVVVSVLNAIRTVLPSTIDLPLKKQPSSAENETADEPCQYIQGCDDGMTCTREVRDVLNYESNQQQYNVTETCKNALPSDNTVDRTFHRVASLNGGILETCDTAGYLMPGGEDDETDIFVKSKSCYVDTNTTGEIEEPKNLTNITCLENDQSMNNNYYVFIADLPTPYDPDGDFLPIGDDFVCDSCPPSFTNQEDDDGKKCCTQLEFDENGDISNNCRLCDCWEDPEEQSKQWWRLS